MSASILYSVSSRTKLILDHVIQYLDAVSSSLATKAAQTTIANNVSSTLANTDTLVTRVPSTAADKTTLDLTKGVADEILLDTASIQPNVSTMYSWVSEIVTDTRELVPDVNEVLLDTAALDSRLNATWSGRLDTSVSSRLSSAVRNIRWGGFSGVTAAAGSSPENRYVTRTITAVTNISKCLVIVNGGLSTTSGDASLLKTGGTTVVYDVGGRLSNTTTLVVYSPAAPGGTSYISATYYIVEFY
jgi:hypothetical protein